MPRTARASVGGMCYHVFNRGNGRAEVFHKDDDYGAFLKLLGQASERVPMRLLAYCLMPNHFHLVVWTLEDGDLRDHPRTTPTFRLAAAAAASVRLHRHISNMPASPSSAALSSLSRNAGFIPERSLSRWMQWLLTAHVRRYHRHQRFERPRLAGAIQGVPDRRRRPSAGGCFVLFSFLLETCDETQEGKSSSGFRDRMHALALWCMCVLQ